MQYNCAETKNKPMFRLIKNDTSYLKKTALDRPHRQSNPRNRQRCGVMTILYLFQKEGQIQRHCQNLLIPSDIVITEFYCIGDMVFLWVFQDDTH